MAFLFSLCRNLWQPFREDPSDNVLPDTSSPSDTFSFDVPIFRFEKPKVIIQSKDDIEKLTNMFPKQHTDLHTFDDSAKVPPNETRIEIFKDPFEKTNHPNLSLPEAQNVCSMATMKTRPPTIGSLETSQMRDITMETCLDASPLTLPLTKDPITSDSATVDLEFASDGEIVIPLSTFYEPVERPVLSEFGCIHLDPNEILCTRQLLGHGASSQVQQSKVI